MKDPGKVAPGSFRAFMPPSEEADTMGKRRGRAETETTATTPSPPPTVTAAGHREVRP
ncbi:hypothetical protein GCM10010400_70810 [Streptomyces aculeolatus]